MPEHIEVGELAEADEGLLSVTRATEVAAHLDSCQDCARIAAQLAEVRSLLAGLPAPEMPTGVAERLDRVVADEQARRDSKPEPVAAPYGGSAPARAPAPGSAGSGSPGSGSPSSGGSGALGSGALGSGALGSGALGSGGGSDGVGKNGLRRLLVALGTLVVVAGLVIGGYVATGLAGLNEPPAAAATAVTPGQLRELAESIRNRSEVDPHRFSRAWICARKVTDGKITGLARVSLDGRSALLVYLHDDNTDSVVVVTGCDTGAPSAAASTTLPR